MNKIKLNPCRFCKSDNVEFIINRDSDGECDEFITCNDCGIVARASYNKEPIITIWNKEI